MQVSRSFVQRLLKTASEFDINKGGLFDARSVCANIWCSPDDKPSCWNIEVTKGGLNYPREYVGGLYWDWLDDDRVSLYLDATPYALLDQARKTRQELSEEAWGSIHDWLKAKAQELIRLAQLQPQTVGTQCPLCSFILPADHLLNDLLDHLTKEHRVQTLEVILGDRPMVVTDRGSFELKAVEKFEHEAGNTDHKEREHERDQ
jgi:hypothetical protein